VFHYLSLHNSEYARRRGWSGADLPQADRYTECLVRLPLFRDLSDAEADRIIDAVNEFFASEPEKA
jgi:dTDP-4-amino-4,6-dideoxygalactose transaminase